MHVFVWFFQFEFNSVFTKCYRPREQKKTPQRIKKDRKKNTQPNWKRNNITTNRSRMFCYQIRNTLYRKRIGNIASGFVCLTQIQFAGNAQLLVCFFFRSIDMMIWESLITDYLIHVMYNCSFFSLIFSSHLTAYLFI